MAALPAVPTGLVLKAFGALPHSTVIVDQDGMIVAVNPAWRRFGSLNGATASPDVGDSYLAACDRAVEAGEETAARAALDIRTLLARGDGDSSLIYPCHSPASRRWFEAKVVAFREADRNFVLIIHEDITAREEAQEALRAGERTLRAVINVMPVGVWILDGAGRIVYGNPAGQRIWAGARLVSPEQFGEYKGWWVSTGKAIEAEEWAAARAIRRGEVSIDEEIEIECFDATRKFILNSALPLRGENGAIEGAIIVNVDVTDSREAAAALRDSEQRWRTLFDLLPVGAAVLDGQNRLVEHNRALEGILGLTHQEVSDRRYRSWRFLGPDGGALGEHQFPSARARQTGRAIDSAEITVEREDGSRIVTSVSAAPLPHPRGATVVVTKDITAEWRAREGERQAIVALERALIEQRSRAETDFLTQVPNRRRFFEVAEHELALAKRHQYAVSVVLLDLDRFKAINDRYGHETGDQVLKLAAQAMRASIRTTDVLARHGGEEFAALLPQTNSRAAGLVAEQLRAAVTACWTAPDVGVAELTISAGVATLRPGDSVDSLLGRADKALYDAKSRGRNRAVITPGPEFD